MFPFIVGGWAVLSTMLPFIMLAVFKRHCVVVERALIVLNLVKCEFESWLEQKFFISQRPLKWWRWRTNSIFSGYWELSKGLLNASEYSSFLAKALC